MNKIEFEWIGPYVSKHYIIVDSEKTILSLLSTKLNQFFLTPTITFEYSIDDCFEHIVSFI